MKKKMILFLVLVLIFLVLVANGLEGEEKKQVAGYTSGDDYLKRSEEFKRAYVMGLIDMLFNETWVYDEEEYSDLNEVTDDMKPSQIQAIFDRFLEEHPETWHLSAASLFRAAMMEIVLDK